MVPKPLSFVGLNLVRFRAVLFRMVPKLSGRKTNISKRFRAVLFRMVPKLLPPPVDPSPCFRAVLFRMVPKRLQMDIT